MADLSPEDLQDAAAAVGRHAGRVMIALQTSTGTPVLLLRPTLERLARAARDLASAPDGAQVSYDPGEDLAALTLIADADRPYVPSSLAELDSDFSLLDRRALSELLGKFLFSDVFPGDPLDRTAGTVSGAVHLLIDHLEGLE